MHFPSVTKWKNLKQVIMIKSQRDLGDKKTEDIRYYITSLTAELEKLLHAVHQHWQVENALHLMVSIDDVFREPLFGKKFRCGCPDHFEKA
jgi:hypothetical protein